MKNPKTGAETTQHRLIAERVLGKQLPDGVQVHHVNHDPSDNKKSNLVVCENAAYHKLIHVREAAFYGCGRPDWRRCNYCHQYDNPENLQISPNGRRVCHPECGKKYNEEYQKRRK
jgi:hypothetical protein